MYKEEDFILRWEDLVGLTIEAVLDIETSCNDGYLLKLSGGKACFLGSVGCYGDKPEIEEPPKRHYWNDDLLVALEMISQEEVAALREQGERERQEQREAEQRQRYERLKAIYGESK